MALELVTDATQEPITYQQALDHMRINTIDEALDEASIDYVETLIEAVRTDVEDFLQRALITQTWMYYLDEWPNKNYIEIPKPPLQSVSSVAYLDETGINVPMTVTTDYLVDTKSNRGRIVLPYDGSWPVGDLYPVNPIRIQFICGYGDTPENVPKKIIQAIKLQVADLYEHRETVIVGQVINKLDTVEKLLYRFKIWK